MEKISHLFWQNSCFYSVVAKQVGDIFKSLWPSKKSWTLWWFISPDWRSSKRVAKLNLYVRRMGKKCIIFLFFRLWIGLPAGGGGGHGPSSFLQLTLLQPGGQVMPTKLLPVPQILGLPPPLFYTGALQCLTLSIDPAGQCNVQSFSKVSWTY